MLFSDYSSLDLSRLPSPCFVIDEVAVERNMKILSQVAEASGAKTLHALKAFSLWPLAHLTQQYLHGTCASGLYEARLGKEHYGGEVHVFSAAFSEHDLRELLEFANHIVFNTPSQLLRFKSLLFAALEQRPELQLGLRVNPEHSEGEVALYDPCAAGSRLGTSYTELEKALTDGEFTEVFSRLSGLHFHTLCEQDFLPLERTLAAFEKKFGHHLKNMQWLNLGGGHHITRDDYQREMLINKIREISTRYDVQIYLEPGEAVAIGCGILTSQVLDIGFNELPQAILDVSATCHMPDILEMPYRPDITNAGKPGEKPFTCRLGGLTCLAGDVIGDYSFNQPLTVGEHIVFEDMAHYTMVKTTTFNGTRLPAIAIWNSSTGEIKSIREFDYQDFKQRLG